MNEKTNISIIIPVFNLDELTKQLFTNAVKSVKDQTTRPDELVIVVSKGTEDSQYVKTFDFGDFKDSVTIIENEGETDFCTQFNLGVSKAKSDWVSLLEQDDELANIYVKNAVKYKTAHKDVELFLPIIIDVDNNGQFIGLCNEAAWANSFSDEIGILDNNALLSYQNFNIDGMVIKKSVINDFGGFKPSIKLTFIYEFLLRMTFKNVKTMVIPRFLYKHVNQRPNSLFSNYRQTIDPIEARWWLSVSKKEYYFKYDRKITYDKQNA